MSPSFLSKQTLNINSSHELTSLGTSQQMEISQIRYAAHGLFFRRYRRSRRGRHMSMFSRRRWITNLSNNGCSFLQISLQGIRIRYFFFFYSAISLLYIRPSPSYAHMHFLNFALLSTFRFSSKPLSGSIIMPEQHIAGDPRLHRTSAAQLLLSCSKSVVKQCSDGGQEHAKRRYFSEVVKK